MKIIITESKLKNAAINLLKKKYGNLKIDIPSDENLWWDGFPYSNNERTIFYYDPQSDSAFVNIDIYDILHDFFSYEFKEMSEIIKIWLLESYGIEVDKIYTFHE